MSVALGAAVENLHAPLHPAYVGLTVGAHHMVTPCCSLNDRKAMWTVSGVILLLILLQKPILLLIGSKGCRLLTVHVAMTGGLPGSAYSSEALLTSNQLSIGGD